MLAVVRLCSPAAARLCSPAAVRQRAAQSGAAGARELNVLFMGSTEYARAVLAGLVQCKEQAGSGIRSIEVACQRLTRSDAGDKYDSSMRGRSRRSKGPPMGVVERLARERRLGVHFMDWECAAAWTPPAPASPGAAAAAAGFDIAVVCFSSPRLPRHFVGAFPRGVVMVHPSLLPKHRGPNAVRSALLCGDAETGVTVAEYSVESMDAGRILAQVPLKIDDTMTRETLEPQLGSLGGVLAGRVLRSLDQVRASAVEQGPNYTMSRRIEDRDLKIVWEKMTAMDIWALHRASAGLRSVHTILRNQGRIFKLMLLDLHLPAREVPPLNRLYARRPPGSFFYARKVPYFEVPCIDGSRIHVTRLLVEGRTPKTALEFVNGYMRETGLVRMLTDPVDPKERTPRFVYPPGHPREHLNREPAEAEDEDDGDHQQQGGTRPSKKGGKRGGKKGPKRGGRKSGKGGGRDPKT
ncbi:hypothetical protein H4R18_001373 [Coemansia javaensis]|uniref:Formyl transferase N-terminal domain-containing protein n=1 Tax=Coemansia javaensis TaxID=2761396 RepID=A0A9W8HF61_9FUNG|nr:hypothetical protein H4R18_001373 [Coemansia javaensis]